jgi:chaperonin cofactor prefoldin
MAKTEDLKAKLIESIEDKIDGIDSEIEKLQKQKRKEEEKVSLLKTRI